MIADGEAVIGGECADDACFDLFDSADFQECIEFFGRDSQYHALLRFGEPDFPGSQSLIFKRSLFQFYIRACLCSHLAYGRGEATTATISDCRIEWTITRLANRIS